MSSRWVPVFEGSMPEVLVLQSSCEAGGIPTFVPDLNLAYLDISARGGNMFAMKLLVPEDRLEDARDLVPLPRRAGIPEVNPDAEELALMARRVRICALLIITAPLAILFYLEYRKRALDAAELPQDHAQTRLAFGFAVAVCAGVLLYGLSRFLALAP